MSALARLLVDKGNIVYGVDIEEEIYTEKNLIDCKIESFSKMNIKKSFFYIIGNAFSNHSLTNYIRYNGFYYMSFPTFIRWYFKGYNFISVAGSHGKTTTTKFLSLLFDESNYIIGDGSARGISNKNIIVESCEYKNTFLSYRPNISLILNIDYDHPDFFKSEDDYIDAFNKFCLNSKVVIINGDDKNSKKIINKTYITYGINKDNDIIFNSTIYKDYTSIYILGNTFNIPFVGIHYAYDFVGAYLVCKLIGVSDEIIKKRIKSLKLPKRRMEEYRFKDNIFIHDYAHHPTEIKMLYESIRVKYFGKNIVCIFQPHTTSRTQKFSSKFKSALGLFDRCYLLNIFTSVREKKNRLIENEIYNFWNYECISKDDALNLQLDSNTVYLYLGAGDIDKIYKKRIEKLRKML